MLALSVGVLSMLPLLGVEASSQAKPMPGNVPAGEDGYRAWLRYEKIDDESLLRSYRSQIVSVFTEGRSRTACIVRDELTAALSGLLDQRVAVSDKVQSGALFVLTVQSALLPKFVAPAALKELGPEGFLIRSVKIAGKRVTLIAANSDIGTLYGAFAFLRLLQTHQAIDDLAISDKPKNAFRILAHSDNTNGVIDRGYSGKSLWHWDQLPAKINPRLHDYCRINASIGLNGVIINKVEADPAFIDSPCLPKVAALADVFRPYGMKVFVSVNFASPMVLGGLTTADPTEPQVRDWWRKKADEIYSLVPDFGGFEVKANSEGMTGPQNYGRTHADGANMLAAALAPHGGIIMWRAFVYDFAGKAADPDRVKRAYLDFEPLDGQFADNVLVHIKNGPLDFQPREPFHPLFGSMPRTRLMGELQLNQEYLGQATHLVYLGTMWQEFLQADTYGKAAASSVADIIEGGPQPAAGGFSATSNLGDDANWTGHHFGQANWFVYGRLAWNPQLSASAIALDWIRMTWSSRPAVIDCIHKMMMESHEAYVSYTMPLGLHHMVGGDHYAPMPEGYGDPRGMFHHAGPDGIGFDRTRAGSDAVDQYHKPLSDKFNNAAECPEKFLLWFHHLPWHHRMASGRTLWQELCFKYDSGTKTAIHMEQKWAALAPVVDARRHAEVASRLHQQVIDAGKWSNHCLDYFMQFSKLPRS
jgi:alpha-glucuronidase